MSEVVRAALVRSEWSGDKEEAVGLPNRKWR